MTKLSLYTIGVLLLLGLLFSYLLSVRHQPVSDPDQNIPPLISSPNTLSQPVNVVYSGPPFTPPPQLSVFASDPTDPHAFASSIAAQLNLPPHAQSQNIWVDPARKLAVNFNSPNQATIISLPAAYQEAIPGLDTTRALQVANDTLSQLQLNLTLDATNLYLTDNPREFYSPQTTASVSPDKARYAIVPLVFTLEGLPFIFADQSPAQSYLIVDSNYQVTKLVLFPPPQNPRLLRTAPTLTAQIALDNLSQGIGIVTHLSLPLGQTQSDLSQLERLALETVSLQFRLDPQSGNIIPYYQFTGTGKSTSSISRPIEVVTPAVI